MTDSTEEFTDQDLDYDIFDDEDVPATTVADQEEIVVTARIVPTKYAKDFWPAQFDIEDGDIIGFHPLQIDGESDYYDADPELVFVVLNAEGDPIVFQSVATWTVDALRLAE